MLDAARRLLATLAAFTAEAGNRARRLVGIVTRVGVQENLAARALRARAVAAARACYWA